MRSLALLSLVASCAAQEATFIIRNATIHPVTAPSIDGSLLLVKDGVIAEIAPKMQIPKTMKVIDAKGLHVYPGLIDSATTLGLEEIGAVRETVDTSELGDFKPQLRTIVAINPASEHIPVARANGITAAMVLPAGGLISGQAGLIRLDGWTWEEMAVSRSAAMVLRFPVVSTSIRGEFFEQPRRVAYKDAKKSYDGQLDKLRLLFEDARRYQKAKARGGPDFSVDRRLEALLPVIEGKLPVLVTAARERAIRESLVFAAKQGIRLILAEPREFGATLEEVKSKKIPVILGKTLSLPLDEDDPYDSQYSLPAELQKAGILFAFGTFDSSAVRNLPYQAAAGVAFGLSKDDALKAVTINAAMIWGVDRTLGSVEPGKSADLILTDGDPLETRTQVKMMFIRGRAVSIESKHTRLYQQYLNRP